VVRVVAVDNGDLITVAGLKHPEPFLICESFLAVCLPPFWFHLVPIGFQFSSRLDEPNQHVVIAHRLSLFD
jgi:hypothetical protein